MKIRIVHSVCCLAFLVLGTSFSISQSLSYNFTNYSIKDGLPSSQVYDIIQDHMGFIWIATDRGVVRFNGDEFQTFTVKDGLTSNVVFHLKEDAENRLWCMGSDRGLCHFNNQTYSQDPKIEVFEFNHKLHEVLSPGLRTLSIHTDKYGIEICSSTGLQSSQRLFISYLGEVRTLMRDEQITVINDSLGVRISSKRTSFTNDSIDLEYLTDDDTMLYSVAIENGSGYSCLRAAKTDENIFFNSSNELFSLNSNLGVLKIAEYSQDIIALNAVDSDNLLIGLRKDGLIRRKNDGSEEVLIPNIYCSSIFLDNEKGIWIGSLFNGIYYLPNKSSKTIRSKDFKSVSMIAGNDQEIYFSNSSFELFRLKNEKITRLLTKFDIKSILSLKNDPTDNSVKIYFGLIEKQFKTNVQYLFNSKTLKSEDINFTPAVKDFLTLDSTILLLISSGICELDFNHENIQNEVSINYKVSSVTLCHDTIFLATDNGVKFLSSNSFIKDYQPEQVFFKHPILNFHLTQDGRKIITTKNHGIGVIDQSGELSILTKDQGLTSNIVNGSIIYQNQVFIWSNKGFSALNQDNELKNYTIGNGLISNHILDLFVRNDTAWVATDEGVSILELNQSKTYIEPSILLTGVDISGKPNDLSDEYDLNYQDQFLDISYQGINFKDKGNSTYRYKLDGHNETWIETKERVVHFSQLPAGNFNFQVSMKTNEGWSKPSSLFTLKKSLAFWQTWWFYLIILGPVSILITLFIKSRLKRIERENRLALSVNELERKALQSQMNPHFVFNSLSSLQSLIIDKKNDLAENYLIKFSRLTRLTLNHSSQKSVLLEDELTLLKNYIELEMLRFQDKFTYSINNETTPTDVFITPMLIQPFVENSILHGLAPLKEIGTLVIDIKIVSSEILNIQVIDNGIGLEKAIIKTTHNSKGINLVRKRLRLLSSDASLTVGPNPNNRGTVVTLNIPYSLTNE